MERIGRRTLRILTGKDGQMKKTMKITVVADFAASNEHSLPIEVGPGKMDDLVKAMGPRIELSSKQVLTPTAMEELSLEAVRAQVGGSSDAVTAVLHDRAFQKVEAALRGVAMLVERLPGDGSVRLEALHAPYDNVRRRILDGIVKPEYEGETETPATLILADYDFDCREKAFEVFADLARMGEAMKVPIAAQTDAGFFGLKHLLHLPTIKNPVERMSGASHKEYRAFRKTQASFWASLLLNRFLMRAPYQTADYEEPASAAKPDQYLWGRGIWILGANLIRSYASKGHLLGLSGLGTGGEQLGLPTRSLPLGRTESVVTPLEASLPLDIVESLPYFGLSPLSQVPDEMGGQPELLYVHLAANLHHMPDNEGKQLGRLTVHTSLAYSVTLGWVSNLAVRHAGRLAGMQHEQAAQRLQEALREELWTKEDDEVSVTLADGSFHIVYRPHLVIHTRRFEVELSVPFE